MGRPVSSDSCNVIQKELLMRRTEKEKSKIITRVIQSKSIFNTDFIYLCMEEIRVERSEFFSLDS